MPHGGQATGKGTAISKSKHMGCRLRQNVRLRSANRGNGNNTWNMNTGGNVNNNNAYNANRCCPDCAYNARDGVPA